MSSRVQVSVRTGSFQIARGSAGLVAAAVRWAGAAVAVLALVMPSRADDADDYAQVAAWVSTPLFPTYDAARAGYRDGAVLLRMERARQALASVRPGASDLKSVADTLSWKVEACHSTLNAIRELDANVPDYEGLVRKVPSAAHGLYAMSGKDGQHFSELSQQDQNAVTELAVKAAWEAGSAIINGIRTSNRWSDYRDEYEAVRKASIGLGACAERRCGAPRPVPVTSEGVVMPGEGAALGIDVDGSFEGAWAADFVQFTNRSSVAMTHCTLLVTLYQSTPEAGVSWVERHVHYVENWPRGESLVAMYRGPDASGIARDESLAQVQRVGVEVYSDQIRNSLMYRYYGTPDYTEDVRRYCKNLRFTGRFNTETAGLFSHDGFGHSDASVQIFFKEGFSKIQPSKITVSVSSGSRSQTFWWEGSAWSSGEWFASKTFAAPEFNQFANPSYTVRIAFPGTDYEHVLEFEPD